MLRTYGPEGRVRRIWIGAPTERCRDRVEGYVCSRAAGHQGRHSTGGAPEVDGTCAVFAVWEPELVAEQCS